jgi:MFS family permease
VECLLLLLPQLVHLTFGIDYSPQGSAFGAPIAGILLDRFGGTQAGVKAFTIPLLVMGLISLLAAAIAVWLRFRLGGIDLKKKI